jgi:hypothetical protein
MHFTERLDGIGYIFHTVKPIYPVGCPDHCTL